MGPDAGPETGGGPPDPGCSRQDGALPSRVPMPDIIGGSYIERVARRPNVSWRPPKYDAPRRGRRAIGINGEGGNERTRSEHRCADEAHRASRETLSRHQAGRRAAGGGAARILDRAELRGYARHRQEDPPGVAGGEAGGSGREYPVLPAPLLQGAHPPAHRFQRQAAYVPRPAFRRHSVYRSVRQEWRDPGGIRDDGGG